MMQQVREHRKDDDKDRRAVKEHGDLLLQDLCRKYVAAILVLLILGLAALIHFKPAILFKHKERLPGRMLITVYPKSLQIKASLPQQIMGYCKQNKECRLYCFLI